MKIRWGVILFTAVVSFVTGGWLMQRSEASGGNVYRQARLFDDVLRHIQAYYVDSIPETDLYHKAIQGLIAELEDPYTVLLEGENFRRLTESTSGNYGGLGIQIDVRDGWITVVAPLPDTPAESLGVQSGDQIIAVDGVSTKDWDNTEAVSTLRGPEGSTVEITVRRAGFEEPIRFNITRAVIHVRSVRPGTLFPNGVGYVSLNTVSEESADELREEIDQLRARGMKSLLLDLRGNPGGLLDQGVAVADLFLDQGTEVVSTRGRARGSTRRYLTELGQSWSEMPIVVLVNRSSASAAEIIAGALQDHDRAIVIGETTWGKGLVQTLYRLGESTALKITTARWYTPSGRSIQRDRPVEDGAFVVAQADSGALQDTTRYLTASGRVIFGGGGIRPDLVVPADTLTSGEQEFFQELGSNWPAYRDAITTFALERKSAGDVATPEFEVTQAMLDQLYRMLVERGGEVERADFDAASDLVSDQLGYEMARYIFGREAEFARRFTDDSQIAEGIRLLERAPDKATLLTVAQEIAEDRTP